MKLVFKGVMFALVISLLCGCNDWLTVDPKDSVSEEDMYKTAKGYESVLNGLYRNMAESNLYGNFLSFGLINVMSHTYDVSKSKTKSFLQAAEYRYTEEEFRMSSQLLWERAYNCIANANNLISRLQTASDDLFNKELDQKNLMLGEAYAVRAYVHFDLLRLYAPAPVVADQEGKYIPYVDTYPCKFATRMTVTEVLNKVVKDLQKARALLAWDTTSMGISNFSYQWSYPNSGATQNEVFYGYRATRFNFYSATAALARVLWYRNGAVYEDPEQLEGEEVMKDYEAAVRFATMVKANTTYRYTPAKEIQAGINDDARETIKMTRELIFALWKENHSEEIGSYYESMSMNYNLADYTGLYQKAGNSSDHRLKYGIYTSTSGYKLTNRWFPVERFSSEEPIIPMIRLSEICYILADCQFDINKSKAITALQQARYGRGLQTQLNKTMGRDEFVKLLIEDARKEFAGEGKMFFLYKQLNEKVILSEGEAITLGSKFVLPIPDSEFILNKK